MIIHRERDVNRAVSDRLKKIWDVPSEDRPFWLRVENGAQAGTFDVFIGNRIGCGWIELKLSGPNARPEMRKAQPSFGMQLRKAGIPAHVLTCSDSGELRLLNGWTLGHDWQDHLLARGHLEDLDSLEVMLTKCMGY
ncbi:MAG: hypothetical protein GY813_07515 [Halieaceae bacterium]|nr:hypothetical protein [Halieaceae bacterium]